jgi:hypothetical protein
VNDGRCRWSEGERRAGPKRDFFSWKAKNERKFLRLTKPVKRSELGVGVVIVHQHHRVARFGWSTQSWG